MFVEVDNTFGSKPALHARLSVANLRFILLAWHFFGDWCRLPGDRRNKRRFCMQRCSLVDERCLPGDRHNKRRFCMQRRSLFDERLQRHGFLRYRFTTLDRRSKIPWFRLIRYRFTLDRCSIIPWFLLIRYRFTSEKKFPCYYCATAYLRVIRGVQQSNSTRFVSLLDFEE